MRCIAYAAAAVVTCLVFAIAPVAQADDPYQREVDVRVDSGFVINKTNQRTVIWSELVEVPGVAWLRLRFDEATLGSAPAGGQGTILRMTSLTDFGVQTLNATHLQQWQHTSAYFNGDRVAIEIIADPGAAPSRVRMSTAWVSPLVPVTGDRSICGPTDDRILSDDPRVGRIYPGRCTIWVCNVANYCILTAGHCETYIVSSGVAEFNCPLSNSSGEPQHPGPEDQYAYDPISLQGNGGQGVGDDWAYFGCFPNSNTGLTVYQAQGDCFILAAQAPPVQGQEIRITGHGVVSSPIPPEWNRAQKTHAGPYAVSSGTTVGYVTDTTSGNSGSPVINEDNGQAIGIHTHGGCSSTGGHNSGTAIHHPDLQWALAHPQGVCVPQCPPDVNGDNMVDVLDLLAVLAAWGATSGPEDINGDGIVDVLDLLEILANWGPCFPMGACCLLDGTCEDLPEFQCISQGGDWHEGEQCATFTCPPQPLGACCYWPSGDCDDLTQWECQQGDGIWYGAGTDCATVTCPVAPPGETISDAIPVPSVPYATTGDTTPYADDYDEVCPYSGSQSHDVVYAYTPAAGEVINITLCADSQYDTKLYVYENEHTPGSPFACNDDACTTPGGQSWVSELNGLSLTGGYTYYIVIDGYGSQNGFYTLDITVP